MQFEPCRFFISINVVGGITFNWVLGARELHALTNLQQTYGEEKNMFDALSIH